MHLKIGSAKGAGTWFGHAAVTGKWSSSAHSADC
jgi:hypothetical protein